MVLCKASQQATSKISLDNGHAILLRSILEIGSLVLNVAHMCYTQKFLHTLMDMGSQAKSIVRTMLNYKTEPMSTLNGLLVSLILTKARS